MSTSASSIEWTDRTWNPVRGCSMARGSENGACLNCYVALQAARNLPAMRSPSTGKPFAVWRESGPRWTGDVELIAAAVSEPLSWREPKRIFVNSMSDLFHESLPDDAIDRVFSTMAWARRHTYQILTKRPERMRAYMLGMEALAPKDRTRRLVASMYRGHPAEQLVSGCKVPDENVGDLDWPLKCVWLGVSVEDQKTAEARIPLLLQTPAAVRFVSYEPAIGPVDFTPWTHGSQNIHISASVAGAIANRSFSGLTDGGRALSRKEAEHQLRALHARGVKLIPATGCDDFDPEHGCRGHRNVRLDWVIVGGESGPGARGFDLEWARAVVARCKADGIACFVKQLGQRPIFLRVGNVPPAPPLPRGWGKGGNPAMWPEDLRVREFPKVAA